MNSELGVQHATRKTSAMATCRVNCGHDYRRLHRATRSAATAWVHAEAHLNEFDGRAGSQGSLCSDRQAVGHDGCRLLRRDAQSSRAYGSGYSSLGSAVVTRWGVAYRRALTTKAPHRSEGPYRVSSRSSEFRGSDLETVFGKFGLASDSPARTRCDLGVLKGGLVGGVPRDLPSRRPEGNLVGGVSHSTR